MTNSDLTLKALFSQPAAWGATWTYPRTYQIDFQQGGIPADATGPAEPGALSPQQVGCVLRNVGTFGIPGNTAATNALEVRLGGTRAQGRGGYNIPSLYGLALSDPYLHHGQATNLADLLTDPKWIAHTQAAAAGFLAGKSATDPDVIDLVAFLLSIDASTMETPAPAGFDACPATYP
jgi:hypothetical protein